MTRPGCAVLLCLLICLTLPAQQTNPAPQPFFSAPQMTSAQQENFSPQLLNELESIKLAALADD